MERHNVNSATSTPEALSGTDMNSEVIAEPRDTQFGGRHANRSHRGGGAVRVHCPHCGTLAKARSSEAITPLFRDLRFQCQNVDGDDFCGATFVAALEIRRMIVQSARPNPRIKLPVAQPRPRRRLSGPASLAANDD